MDFYVCYLSNPGIFLENSFSCFPAASRVSKRGLIQLENAMFGNGGEEELFHAIKKVFKKISPLDSDEDRQSPIQGG